MFKKFSAVLGLVIIICFSKGGSAQGYFSHAFKLETNKISVGDWTGPLLEIINSPEENEVFSSLELTIKGTDNYSGIASFEFGLFSQISQDPASDWVLPPRKIDCADGECGNAVEEGRIVLSLSGIENPNHKLCEEDERWCLGKPLPCGNYHLIIRAFDSSKTINEAGNKSEDLTYDFIKKSPDLPG